MKLAQHQWSCKSLQVNNHHRQSVTSPNLRGSTAPAPQKLGEQPLTLLPLFRRPWRPDLLCRTNCIEYGLAPQCLTEDCQLVSAAGRRQLRSSDAVTMCSATDPYMPRRSCVRSRRTTSVERFADQPPSVWPLPWTVRRALKTHLFDCVCRA